MCTLERSRRRQCMVAVFLLVALTAMTSKAIAGTPLFNRPLGELYGTAPARVSFDGRNWISLGSGSLPVFNKMLVKTRSGVVTLTLSDGSRLEASPTTELTIAAMGSSTIVHVAEGNVLFRLRPASSARLSTPGGVIYSTGSDLSRSGLIATARVSTGAQAQRDAVGMITAQKGGSPRVRLVSGEVFLVSQNGSVTEMLREGQVRIMRAQAAEAAPTPYLIAQSGGPTDPPGLAAKPEQAGKRECGQFPWFRRTSSGELDKLPPPVDPPSQPARSGQTWAWHPSNPSQVTGGWQEVQLGSPPVEPPRPDELLDRGFTWSWEEKPQQRWVVTEEWCFFVPAAYVLGGSTAAAAISAPFWTDGDEGHAASHVASDVAPR